MALVEDLVEQVGALVEVCQVVAKMAFHTHQRKCCNPAERKSIDYTMSGTPSSLL